MGGTCLILGGAQCVWEDARKVFDLGGIDATCAVNDMVAQWPYELDVAASLHPDKLVGWLKVRKQVRNRADVPSWYGPNLKGFQNLDPTITLTRPGFTIDQRSGSSGLFAAKVCLVDLGFDRVVLAGVPMMPGRHFDGADRWAAGRHGEATCRAFRAGWLDTPDQYKQRMRSMSGWTRILLGAYDGRDF